MKFFHNGEMNGGASFLVQYRVSRAVGSSSYYKPEQAGIATAVVLLFLIDIGVLLYVYYLIEGHNTRTDVPCIHYRSNKGKTSPKRVHRGCSNYPPYPMAVLSRMGKRREGLE